MAPKQRIGLFYPTMTSSINPSAHQTTPAVSVPIASKKASFQAVHQDPSMENSRLMAQPRQDVLAVDGKIYVETSPEQLLYEKRRMLARQQQQPAWVNNLIQSAILAGVFSAVGSVFSFVSDAFTNTLKVASSGERLKHHALHFAGYFAVSTAGLFIANTVLQAINHKRND